MKKKLWGIAAGLICCALCVAAIIVLQRGDDGGGESHIHTHEESSSQEVHSDGMLASREDIKSVTVTSGGESFTAVAGQNGAQPHIKELEGIKQDHMLESALFSLCSGIRAEKLVEQDASDPEKYGLGEQPLGKAEITYSDGTRTSILVGESAPSNERQFYAAIEGQKSVWLVEGSVSVYFTGKAKDYVSKVVSPVAEKTAAQSAKMTVSKEGAQDIVLERSGEKWSMSAPIKAELDAEKASGTVNGLYGLNSEYCEAVRPSDAVKAQYGLDKPAVTVAFSEGSYDLKLKIGRAVVRNDASEKKKYYCYLEGGADTDCIYAIAKEYLPWVDITPQGLLSEIMLPNYLVNLKSISIDAGGKKTEFIITNEGGDNSRINEDISKLRTVKVTSGGRELDLVKFREFYAYLMSCPTGRLYTNDVKNDAYVTVVFVKNDGSADRLELVAADGGYGARVNGQVSYLVEKSWVDKLIVEIDALG